MINTLDLEELQSFLKIPSISAQSEHDTDTRTCAEWLVTKLTKIGLTDVQLLETKRHPVVFGQWLGAPGKPTVLIYGHYDVQSPDPLDQWETGPFTPTVRNGNLYARGVADDKGQIFCHIKAVEQLMSEHNKLPINVKFIIEGEEEIGGPDLDPFIESHKELLKADICVISDSHAFSATQPQVCYGLRGLVYFQIDLSVMPKDVHSGSYGGNVPSATTELINLLSKLKDDKTQEIKIPRFYDSVRQLSDLEQKDLSENPFNEEAVLSETGAKKILGVAGKSVAQRGGALPTLDIHGLWGGYSGEGPKTIIPSRAGAKVSMRIVPNQTSTEVTKLFSDFIKENTPDYVDVKCELLSVGEPLLMNRDSDYFKKAEEVMTKVFGNKPIYSLEGGSIPVTYTFKQLLGIDSILMGFGLPDDGLHSPNEKMSLEMLEKGILTSKEFLNAL